MLSLVSRGACEDPAGLMRTSFDEFWSDEAQPRDHQRLLWDQVRGLAGETRVSLARTVERRLREQDVTFNLYGIPDIKAPPWTVDWLPTVLSANEFSRLSAALQQRAQLLNLALEDLYGPRRLLTHRVIPADIVLGNPNYTRAAHGWLPVGGGRLTFYAADIGRAPTGDFVVFSDRTAAPTGSGYALQNRMVVGRALPEAFRQYHVAKLDSYFASVAAALEGLWGSTALAPRVVVLTPGSTDESAFEHAYLARYLGFDLVEGRDLTVRDGKVYLKSLAGLLRVDVILRRVFDSQCDPLQLRGDSIMGVPGLLEAARRGTVALANPLGSSLVESAVFKAYLPAISAALLGTYLELPSVPTLFCGEPTMLTELLDSPERWILKPSFENRRHAPIHLAQLDAAARDSALARVRREPHRWVAEQWPELSRTIVGTNTENSAALTLRMFLCRSNESDSFAVMPGALGRLNASPDGVFDDRDRGRSSKDVWIPAVGTGSTPKLPTMPEPPVKLLRGGVELPSRLLDDVHWLGRYVERCDAAARLLLLGLERRLDAGNGDFELLHRSWCAALADMDVIPSANRSPHPDTLLQQALIEGRTPNNIPACLHRVNTLTEAVRDRLSRNSWTALRQFAVALKDLGAPSGDELPDRAADELERLVLLAAAVRGTLDSMVRGYAWSFMQIGQRLELAAIALSTMRAFLPIGATRHHMAALLDASDSLLTYRARYLTTLRVAPVVDLLLTDTTNPRSVLYQVEQLLGHAAELPTESRAALSAPERGLVQLRALLLSTDVIQLCAGDGVELRRLLDEAAGMVRQIADSITRLYFTHAPTATTTDTPQWVEMEEF